MTAWCESTSFDILQSYTASTLCIAKFNCCRLRQCKVLTQGLMQGPGKVSDPKAGTVSRTGFSLNWARNLCFLSLSLLLLGLLKHPNVDIKFEYYIHSLNKLGFLNSNIKMHSECDLRSTKSYTYGNQRRG